jgi:hypothetical protein
MKSFLSKYIDKLYFKKWVIGICQYDVKDIIRNKTFNGDIKWLKDKSFDKFDADPFPLSSNDIHFKILIEEFIKKEGYAKISLMTLAKGNSHIQIKPLLKTKSHLSYPFIYRENEKVYVFPESSKNGKLSCYEFITSSESLVFVKDILTLPLKDSTIIKHSDKFWIFGSTVDDNSNYILQVFYSNELLGPYHPHPLNGKIKGLDGIRPAGNILKVDGVLYRPSQNCKNKYGESITINKVNQLNEVNFEEEPYMEISVNNKKKNNNGIHCIHTINAIDNFIFVDGQYWIFSPNQQLKSYFKKAFKHSVNKVYEY